MSKHLMLLLILMSGAGQTKTYPIKEHKQENKSNLMGLNLSKNIMKSFVCH